MNSHSTPAYTPDFAESQAAVKRSRQRRSRLRPSSGVASKAFQAMFQPLVIKAGGVTRLVPWPSPRDAETVEAPLTGVQHLVCPVQINVASRINKFFEAANRVLPEGGLLMICGEMSHQREQRFRRQYPAGIGRFLYGCDFLINRVMPKLPGLKALYFRSPLGRYRVVSETEVLGRLYCCGFDVVDRREQGGFVYMAARKVRDPAYDSDPTYGPLCRLKRTGYQGRPIRVLKLRTMHPYSEYLQEYVHRTNSLHENGKFKDDFRVTSWGQWCRKFWLDELPMLLNWLKGDLKLVGVRPLSAHYLSLYPKDLQELRSRHKPGLLPPYYADLPRSLEEIVESERRYLLAREKAPFRTDVRYFFRAVANILFRGARSA